MENSTKIEALWLEKARSVSKTIVLPEAGFSDRIVKAGLRCAEEKIAKVVLLVRDDKELDKYGITENDYLQIININTHEIKDMLVSALYEKRKEKGLTLDGAKGLISDPVYFGTMMVDLSLADGLGMGLGFTIALTIVGIIREFLSAGTIFNIHMQCWDSGFAVFGQAPGGFIVLGILLAGMNYWNMRKAQKKGIRYVPPADFDCRHCALCSWDGKMKKQPLNKK